MTDTPAQVVPIPWRPNPIPAVFPPPPPFGWAWTDATYEKVFRIQVAAHTKDRIFNSGWQFWSYAQSEWRERYDFLEDISTPVTVESGFALENNVTALQVHIVPSTKNANAPFWRWRTPWSQP